MLLIYMMERFLTDFRKLCGIVFGTTQFCALIGLQNTGHSLNQSDAKLNPRTIWSLAFSRASGGLLVFTLSSHWLLGIYSLLLIGLCDYFLFCFYDTIEKRCFLENNTFFFPS